MNKYIIRGTFAAVSMPLMVIIILNNKFDQSVETAIACIILGLSLFEFAICLICYHHALWNQDQTEQKSPDGTK
jgi:hypothetical protein